jgi:hypothetical protein
VLLLLQLCPELLLQVLLGLLLQGALLSQLRYSPGLQEEKIVNDLNRILHDVQIKNSDTVPHSSLLNDP